MEPQNFAAVSKRTIAQRIWRWLGYGFHYDEGFWDWRCAEPAEGDWWVPGVFSSTTVVHVDWKDRIRLLISGQFTVIVCSRTDVQIGRTESRSRFAVKPPTP